MTYSRLALALLAFLALPYDAAAEVLSTSDPTIENSLCVGRDCGDPADFVTTHDEIVLSANNIRLRFEDTSDPGGNNASDDWALVPNDNLPGGQNRFILRNLTHDTDPFVVDGDAPTSAAYISATGRIGIGTMLPQERMHMVSAIGPGLRFEQTGNGLFQPQTWTMRGQTAFYVSDITAGTTPFRINRAAPDNTLVVDDTGHVGIGTLTPGAPLEVLDDETFSFFRITAADAAINQSVDITFTQGPLGTGEMRYNIVDGDGPEMRLNADGDMVLDGTLTTGGPTCSGGCDAVFTKARIIPERDYAARMWADGHLPHVGPTPPEAPINVSEKLGGMLNALEHAHVFIDRQNRRIETLEAERAAQDARFARLEAEKSAQAARLARLEARLSAIETGARAD